VLDQLTPLLNHCRISRFNDPPAALGDVALGAFDFCFEFVSEFQFIFKQIFQPFKQRSFFWSRKLRHVFFDLLECRHITA